MPEPPCWDPLEVPCGPGVFRLVRLGTEDTLPVGLTAPCLVSLPQDRVWPTVDPTVGLELRCENPDRFEPESPGRAWNLFLEYVRPFVNDDLGLLEQVMERAAWAGCAAVVAPGFDGESTYRYRWFSLVRMLCDRLRLRFSVWEPRERPEDERLNRYLASQRGCCRLPGFKPRESRSGA